MNRIRRFHCHSTESAVEYTRNPSASHSVRLGISSDVEQISTFRRRSLSDVDGIDLLPLTENEVKRTDLLDRGIEGFSYDPVQNSIFVDEFATSAIHCDGLQITVLRYFVLFSIGICTSLAACVIDFSIEVISHAKYKAIASLFVQYPNGFYTSIPGFVWWIINAILTGIAATLVVFIAPVASGSGIPQIKCYLNGLNVPRAMRCLTMLVKGVGVILSVSGGLVAGKEGPMIHIGSVIAAGLSQGRLTFCKISFRSFKSFRNDQEKRDFISAGAAAGVASAFGAPVGGLLFALEEGASFVYQRLIWSILFTSMVSMFTLALFKSVTRWHEFKFTPGGLLSFGNFTGLNNYNAYEILVFLILGIIGGLSGALFVKANVILTRYRQRYVSTKPKKIMDAMLVTSLITTCAFAIMWLIRDCSCIANTGNTFPLKMMCADNEFNAISSLLFCTPERALRYLLHDPPSTYSIMGLTVFFLYYYCFACLTYGLSVPSGLFIPALLVGASWGRVIGNLLHQANPVLFADPGKFALIGAAAQLGGIVRMTLSLTVILMEATGNVIVGLPLLITLTMAKCVGDRFTEGIYDEHISLNSMALLPWEPDSLAVTKRAYDIMCSPVIFLNTVMRVGDLVERVCDNLHHGFPVIEGTVNFSRFSYGTLMGIISAEHLALLLHKRVFVTEDGTLTREISFNDYDDAYPSHLQLKDVLDELDNEDMDAYLDLRPYMCEAPYSVPETMTMPRVFSLFRLLGLRHLPVVDHHNQLRGMITRKDLRRYRFQCMGDDFRVDELEFSQKM